MDYLDKGERILALPGMVKTPRSRLIGTGVYKSDDYFMPIHYIENIPELKFYTQRNEGGSDDSKYSITITSITDKSISGHFTGNYLEESMEENDLVEITEGQFVAERVR